MGEALGMALVVSVFLFFRGLGWRRTITLAMGIGWLLVAALALFSTMYVIGCGLRAGLG